MNKEYSTLQKELQEGRAVLTFTTGTSMEPLLHDKNKPNATHVLIVPIKKEPAVGEMPFVRIKEDTYMIHRIIDIKEKDGKKIYVTRGDNCIGSEHIMAEQILGVVQEIYQGKKTIKMTDRKYLRYVKRRMNNYPFRIWWMRTRMLASRIKGRLG